MPIISASPPTVFTSFPKIGIRPTLDDRLLASNTTGCIRSGGNKNVEAQKDRGMLSRVTGGAGIKPRRNPAG